MPAYEIPPATPVDGYSSPKVETTGAKESHALQLEQLAKECLKGAVLSVMAVQQAAEERQVSTMVMA